MHARGDGSFGRSAGAQTLKGAVLLAVAVIIGVVLLHTAPASVTTVNTSASHSPTTRAPSTSRTTRPATGNTVPPLAPQTTAAPQAHPPAQVKVAVANGSGVPGLAGRIRAQLNSAGYNTAVPALNAPSTPTTVVYYVAGYQPDAAQIASGQLSLPASVVKPLPSPPPVAAAQIPGVEVLVVAGTDIGGATTNTTEAPAGNTIAPSPAVSSSATTTTPHTVTTVHTTTTAPHTTTTAHTTSTA
jgi:hypothetical protein